MERMLGGRWALLFLLAAAAATGAAAQEREDDAAAEASEAASEEIDPLALWDDNGNGRITCEEARRHGIAPVTREHPAYAFMYDADGDGVVCE